MAEAPGSDRRGLPSRRMRRVLVALAILLPLFLALAAAEVAIRVLSPSGYITPAIRKERALPYKSSLFARHVFGQEAREVPGPAEGQTYRINRHGYRGPDFAVPKNPGSIRIIAYGGSATFDIAANEGEDWPRLLEQELRRAGHERVEVINAGIPGHASFDSFGRFYSEGHKFDPDYILLYNAWNDIKYFTSDETLLRHYGPYDETADPRLNYRSDLDRFLCETSQLYVRLRSRYDNARLDADLEGRVRRDVQRDDFGPDGPRQYRLNVELFVDGARNAGVVPILITQGRLVAADNTTEVRERVNLRYHGLTHGALVRAFDETDRILRAVADAKGVPLIDASAELTGDPDVFSDYVHLNFQGSSRLAGIVAREMIPWLEVDTAD